MQSGMKNGNEQDRQRRLAIFPRQSASLNCSAFLSICTIFHLTGLPTPTYKPIARRVKINYPLMKSGLSARCRAGQRLRSIKRLGRAVNA